MPFRRSFRRRSRNPSKVRSREWVGVRFLDTVLFQPTVILFPTSTTTIQVYADYIFDPDELTSAFDEPTLLRCLIDWNWLTNSAPPGDVLLSVGMGLIKLSLENTTHPFSAGDLANTPLPFWDGDSPWIWHHNFDWILQNGTRFASQIHHVNTDIRTRRKFDNGEGLALVGWTKTNAAIGGGAAWWGFNMRMLLANR